MTTSSKRRYVEELTDGENLDDGDLRSMPLSRSRNLRNRAAALFNLSLVSRGGCDELVEDFGGGLVVEHPAGSAVEFVGYQVEDGL